MRERLRKKKFLGEFQVLGFSVDFAGASNDPGADDRLCVAFLQHAIEGNGLLFGGTSGCGIASGFVVPEGGCETATEAHRESVRRWLAGQAGAQDVKIGPLRDANHGW